jgi:protein tyrosine phosphatase
LTQYHYTAWPDKSVPDTGVSLLEFRDMVEKKITPNAGPMIVHCRYIKSHYYNTEILFKE